jgi:molybdopterin-guanine dinucleotide biosynthesis protein A
VAGRGLTGVLLVGGASSRFGSPKPLARLGGRTLAEIAWVALEFCEERIAVGKAADRLDLPFPVVDDGTEIRAPIAGVVAGLRAAKHDLCVILPVDMPTVGPQTLLELVAACIGDVAVPQTGPLPGAYRRTALRALEPALERGTLSLRDAITDLDMTRVDVDPALLVNVNTPDDVAAL